MTTQRCNAENFKVFLDEWNLTQNLRTPTIHFRIANWLNDSWENGQTRLLLQAFRASGKSTLIGLFLAWLLYRDPDFRILVLSAEASLSEKMARTIRKVVERHPLTKRLRPSNPDQWAGDSFTVNRERISRDPSVMARSIHANITGARADIIVYDDVEVPNTCDTAEKRADLRERLLESQFVLVPGGTQLYIGTPHSYYSIYAQAPRREIGEEEIFLKDYKMLSIPILEDGVSSWPQRYDEEKIEQMRRDAGPMKFASQMMLVPMNIEDSRLDPALLRRYGAALDSREAQQSVVLSIGGKKIVSASAWWDPSFGKESGDGSVLAVVFTDEDGNRWLHRVEYISSEGDDETDEATRQCRIVVEIARELFLPSIAVETNGIGGFLPSILRRELAAADLSCSVLEKTSRIAKSTRILEAFDAVMAARALHVHDSVYKTRFMMEMQEWRPSAKGGYDDGLDAAAGALSLEPMRIKRQYSTKTRLWTGSGSGHMAVTEFEV